MAENKTPISENTSLAKKVAAGVIALSILVIGPVKLNGIYSKTYNVFKSGEPGKSYAASVCTALEKAADAGNKLSLAVNDSELGKLAEKLKNEDDPEDMLELFSKLKVRADSSYYEYMAAHPELKDKGSDAELLYKEVESWQRAIIGDVYWRYAADYSSERSGFPASLLAMLGGAHKLPDRVK